jgi:hypothetical protein
VILRVTRALLMVVGAAAFTLMLLESRFLYHPERGHDAVPDALGLAYEDVAVRTRDGLTLHGWFLPHRAPRATLLFFHGNAGNISHRLPKARILHALGLNVFLLDYRGYGRSEGRPNERGTYRDAQAAWEALQGRPGVDASRVVCFGESLGGAVAIDLATRARCRALVVESSFTSVPELAADLFHIPFLKWLVATRYDSRRKLPSVRAPVLFIHGTEDDLVPFSHAERLFAAANEPKDLFPVPRAGHNDVFMVAGRSWGERIDAFLSNALRLEPARL